MDEKAFDGTGSGFGDLKTTRPMQPGDLTVDDYAAKAEPTSDEIRAGTDRFAADLRETAAKSSPAEIGPDDEQPGYEGPTNATDEDLFDDSAKSADPANYPSHAGVNNVDASDGDNSPEPTGYSEERRKQDTRQSALHTASQVHQGRGVSAEKLISEAAKLTDWVSTGEIPPPRHSAAKDGENMYP